ncbi:DUF4493 domain-containing protein [uncultured Duncaniella sp.]|uniref:DUF4493 domain-containing protein n=1 Tax=uncultured Duncaniella sp. TaxID=2768039 RepID=UPI0025F06934|nr:DUF4493 domain-containing protein [uncultured Duncaniella sp.]
MHFLRPRLLRLFPWLSCLLILCACDDNDSLVNTGTARLSVNVKIDNTFTYPGGNPVETTDFVLPDISEVAMSMSALAGEYSHVWPSFDEFPQNDVYFAGTYFLKAFYGYGQEGYGKPYYDAESTIDMLPGAVVSHDFLLRPVSTANRVIFPQEFIEYFTSVKAYLHADGGGYFEYLPSQSEILYLLPGNTSLYLELGLPDGRTAGYRAVEIPAAKSGVYYTYELSLSFSGDGDPVVTCKGGDDIAMQVLTESFLMAQPPVITPIGWEPGVEYVLPEGEIPDIPVIARISSFSPLSHLMLTVNSTYLNSIGVPRQCDLLNLTEEESALFASLGLAVSGNSGRMELDFSTFLGKLVFLNEAQAITSIGLLAEDSQGRVGVPVMATVRSVAMEISVTDVPAVMVGEKEAQISVATIADDFASNVGIEILDDAGRWTETSILSVEEESDGLHTIRFAIPETTSDINARILYCKEVRADFVINRFMPSFELEVDAFATYSCVRVNAATPDLVATIVRGLYIFLNGRQASVLVRYPERGVVVITNLTPSTTYSLTSTMMNRPDEADFTPELRFSTESTPALPNAEFEERKEGIIYANLPSGGRYSQTEVAIFNWQNHTSFDQKVPKEWANTNSKTFSRKSANPNTWYMQPSVFTAIADTEETSFAVCLQSVAFDLNGPIIPDYTQTGKPYLKYSPIVPEIASRAAGKLFLGSYSFDPATMQETYNDVVDWRSRPMSLNGYYKYNPSTSDPSDTGLAIIEVYGKIDGKDVVIGSSVAHLPVANSYTAFKASLSYDYFGVKATGLKVMFASSAGIGTIEEESAAVITTPDPVSGASIGSTLWLDHISLSY